MIKEEAKKGIAKRSSYQNIPKKVRKEIGRYAFVKVVSGTKAVIHNNSKIYLKYDLKHTFENTSKSKYKINKENSLFKNSGKPNLLSDGLLQKTKGSVIGTHQARNSKIEKNGDCYWNRCKPLLLSFYFMLLLELLFWASVWYYSFCLTICTFHLFSFSGLGVFWPSLFYLLSSQCIGSSRLMADECLYFIFVKLFCVHAIFSFNDHLHITTHMSLEFASRLTNILSK